jgi:hypothetical protein
MNLHDVSSSELKAGNLVRYGSGPTALMVLDAYDKDSKTWLGIQCMGGMITMPASLCSRVAFKDRRMWVQCAKYRHQTTEAAMDQIGYVVGKESNDATADAGEADADVLHFQDDGHGTIRNKPFIDTPEARPSERAENITMSREDWQRHHDTVIHWFWAGILTSAALSAIISAVIVRL